MSDLVERCQELLDWHATGLLNGGTGGRIRALADTIRKEIPVDNMMALSLAEDRTKDEAMRAVIDLRSKLASAEAERDTALTDGADRIADLNAELDAANAQMRELGRQLAEAGEARIAAEAENRELRAELERREAGSVRDAERIAQLREALEIIAGKRQCIDNLMGNADIAEWALKHTRPSDYRERVRIEHDGFEGDVIGHYQTREGKRGVVLQQHDTRVVHVYGEKWVRSLGDSNANG